MSLRAKFILIVVAFSVLLTVYVGIYWLPEYERAMEAQQRQELSRHLASVSGALAPLIDRRESSAVKRALNAIVAENEGWLSLELVDNENNVVYTAQAERTEAVTDAVDTLREPLKNARSIVGELVLRIDTSAYRAATARVRNHFVGTFLGILVLLLLAAVVVLELGVGRRLKQLSKTSALLAKGDLQAPLPPGGRDEVGALVDSLGSMREVIKRYQLDLSFQATRDPVTALVNRREFERRLNVVLNLTKTERSQHALMYLDLDQFKVVNDTCGHTAGDEYLRQLGGTLQAQLRKHDTLARLGGDEFGILLEHCPEPQAIRIAEELLETIQNFRFNWEGRTFALGASIGIVFIDELSGGLSRVLSVADAACYAAKDAGRSRIHVYREDDSTLVRRHGEMQWVSRITEAVQQDRFHLFYQLIVPVGMEETGEGLHFELLLRMEERDGKIITPGSFLHAAERYNLMPTLDRWVTQAAFSWLASQKEQLDRLEVCSINLSGYSLGNPEFMQFVLKKFDEGEVSPEKICFEVTETAAIANLVKTKRFMSILKDRGCRFSLDDFGSGMSSFAYLKNLPVDYLKIDGVFVKDIVDDPVDFALVKAFNDVGHVLGKRTVAEFVEKEAILVKLREIGVDYAQGYGIAKPRPLRELEESELSWQFGQQAKQGAS
jgi:diguanylate cyclase (GGDEF)-like protein